MKKEPAGRNDEHKSDYSMITDQIIIGSDLCKNGVCKEHGAEFMKLGVKVEINLSDENNELPPKDGIQSYTWLPVVDGHAPSQMQFCTGVGIIDSVVRRGEKIYVHCKNGHGRSPSLVLAYLVCCQGLDVLDAEKRIKEKRPEIHIEKEQMDAIYKFKEQWEK